MILQCKSKAMRLLHKPPPVHEIMEPGLAKKNQIDHMASWILRYNYQQAFGLLRTGRLKSRTSPRSLWALSKTLSFQDFSTEFPRIRQAHECDLKTGGGEQGTLGVSGHLGNEITGPRWAKTLLLDRMRARS